LGRISDVAFNGAAGAVNTGNGGGGAGDRQTGGSGGKGVVIISYPNTFADAASTTGSPTYGNSGGKKYYIFNDSGTIIF
jgi:hypothetical protein